MKQKLLLAYFTISLIEFTPKPEPNYKSQSHMMFEEKCNDTYTYCLNSMNRNARKDGDGLKLSFTKSREEMFSFSLLLISVVQFFFISSGLLVETIHQNIPSAIPVWHAPTKL